MIKQELKSGSLSLDSNLNKKVNPFLADDGFYKADGIHLDEALSISKWSGFQKFNQIQLTETGTPATFTGIFDYIKSDQSRKQLATTTKGFYLYNSPIGNAWNALDLTGAGGDRTGAATDLFDGVILNDIFYCGNGVDANLKYDGTTVMNMGITGPSAAQTSSFAAAAGVAGALTGTYSYKVTYYNSTLGHESNPSDDNTAARSVSVTVAAQKVNLTGIPVSADPQVNKRKIYRTTASGGIWLYLTTIADNSTTTYTDNAADTTLGVAIDTTGNGVPPTFAFIEIWNGYVFMVAKNSSRVYFSKAGYPNAVDSNDYRDLDANDGTVITGLKRIQDTLVVYKNSSIWNAYGSDRNTFGFTRRVHEIGSSSNQGIVPVPGKNIHIFPSTDCFHSYNGIAESIVGIGVQKDYQALNQSRLSAITGRPHKTRKLCLWLGSTGANSQNDQIIWYDYLQDKWGTRSITNTPANVIANLLDSGNREQFYIGGYNGYVWQGDSGGTDDGSAISLDVIDRAHPKTDFNNSEKVKGFYSLFVWFSPVPGATISVSYAVDDPDGSYTSLGTIDASKASGQARIRFNATGRRIYPRFQESSTLQGMIMRGWEVYYKVLGRSNAA